MNEKQKAVEAAVQSIEKHFGKGTIMQLGAEPDTRVAVIPSGSVGLDKALGTGGWARGRLTEIFGEMPETRSTLALHAVAQCQAFGGVAAYVDLRHALDIETARRIGVRIADLLISQPETAEQGLDVALHLVRSGAVDLIVFDAETLFTREEIDPTNESSEGLIARTISHTLRQLCAAVSRSGTALLILDEQQSRAPGNNALKFYSSVRVEVKAVAAPPSVVEVWVVKNKLAPPFQRAAFTVTRDGIDRQGEVLQLAVELGLAEKAGSHYLIAGERIGQGAERAREWLVERPSVTEELAQKILTTKAVR